MKKVGIVLGCLFGVFVVLAITLPLIIDVDKFRPEIIRVANENINGKLELGKLSLSLWGGVKIRIEKLAVTVRGEKTPVLQTDSAYIGIPFLPLLIFSPRVTAVLEVPKLNIVRKKNGTLNVMDLMAVKPKSKSKRKSKLKSKSTQIQTDGDRSVAANSEARTPAAKDKSETTASAASDGPPAIPAFVANASIGIRIIQGDLKFIDRQGGGKYRMEGVEVDVRNLGLKETIELYVTLPIEGKAPGMTLSGPIGMEAQITPILVDNQVKSASGKFKMDGKGFTFSMSNGMVKKTSSMPMSVDMEFDGTENDVRLKNLKMNFAGMELFGKGVFVLSPKMTVQMELTSPKLDLSLLEQLVPMMKEYSLQGLVNLRVKATGPPEKLRIKGEMNLTKGSVAYPSLLKKPLAILMNATFSERSMNLSKLLITGPDSDMNLTGSVTNFMKPQFNFNLKSKKINVDKMLKMGTTAQVRSTREKALALLLIPTAYAAKSRAKPMLKNPMAEMGKNKIMMGMAGKFAGKIGTLMAKGAPITNISVVVKLAKLQLNVEKAYLETFGGKVTSNFKADLKSVGLNYSTQGSVKGISAAKALTTYFPTYKDTLDGKASAKWNLSGKIFPDSIRIRSISGTANLSAVDGAFRTVDVQDSIAKIMQKVPFLKGRRSPKLDEGFKSLNADLRFKGGVIDVNPINVVGRGRGFTIKGKSKIQENLTQETYVDVYDPNRLLPKDISDGKGPALALRITGSLMEPKTDYGYTVSRLAKKAIQNRGKQAVSKGIQRLLGGGGGGDKKKNSLKKALKKFKLF